VSPQTLITLGVPLRRVCCREIPVKRCRGKRSRGVRVGRGLSPEQRTILEACQAGGWILFSKLLPDRPTESDRASLSRSVRRLVRRGLVEVGRTRSKYRGGVRLKGSVRKPSRESCAACHYYVPGRAPEWARCNLANQFLGALGRCPRSRVHG